MGLLNTDPAVQLNATFAPVFPPRGRVALSSQSGALGLAVLELARRRRLGLSTFVSVGNKADVSTNDLLQYWEEDDATGVILLYLESFGNPRRFARIARRVSRSKPIVAMKAGRTPAGKRAAGSHTAALASNDVAVDALFRQTGVIRAETLEEMFDIAATLGSQPLPRGRRVAVITNAGGPGILCVDACAACGLVLPELANGTTARLRAFLPSTASVANPVDMIASGGAGKPVLACVMTEDGINVPLELASEKIPSYAFPESAARVLGKVASYAEWRSRPLGTIPDFDDLHPAKARELCRKALHERGAGWLTTEETRAVLTTMGLPVAPGGLARTADEAEQLAQALGFPVAVKLASHRLVHKTEIGGVHLNLGNETAVRQAYEKIRDRLLKENNLAAMEGVLVQPMFAGGVEVMAGVTQDPLFGPLIAFGLGGIHVEILGDVRFRVTPLTDRDAGEMVREIRGYRLLEGYRGHPPADVAAIQDVLLRVSRLVEDIPEIKELDLNPIFALPPGEGCRIVDARIRVE